MESSFDIADEADEQRAAKKLKQQPAMTHGVFGKHAAAFQPGVVSSFVSAHTSASQDNEECGLLDFFKGQCVQPSAPAPTLPQPHQLLPERVGTLPSRPSSAGKSLPCPDAASPTKMGPKETFSAIQRLKGRLSTLSALASGTKGLVSRANTLYAKVDSEDDAVSILCVVDRKDALLEQLKGTTAAVNGLSKVKGTDFMEELQKAHALLDVLDASCTEFAEVVDVLSDVCRKMPGKPKEQV